MIIVDRALEERHREGRPIRIGMVGAGYMGRGMLAQVNCSMVGMDVVAVANRTVEAGLAAYAGAGIEAEVVSDLDRLDAVVSAGGHAVSSDPVLLCRSRHIDAIMEATGEVEFGAHVAVAAIEAGKHLVLVNAELDATVGPVLKVRADQAGVVITNADGDEPGVAMNLLRFVSVIGYRPVLVGNVKGLYDPHRNPDTQLGFAAEHGQRPRMVTSFADGTKLSMEATVLANATGFGVTRRGMNGYRCSHVREVLDLYGAAELLHQPLVDFVLGAEPGSGAFVVGYDDHPERQRYMRYFKMGEGPLYLFYRPFHLTHLEAPLSVARAVLFRDPTITPLGRPVCEVVALAKKDLEPGETLDGIGGFTCYGLIDMVATARRDNLVPMGLTEGCMVVRPVPADRPITYEDVLLPQGRLVDRLRAEQEDHFG